jgi:hypothetical protein
LNKQFIVLWTERFPILLNDPAKTLQPRNIY